MDVRITVPETMMGDIMSDLNTRRGRVQGMDTVGIKSVVTAEVPLAEMLRYGNDLRSMTGGRGIYTMGLQPLRPRAVLCAGRNYRRVRGGRRLKTSHRLALTNLSIDIRRGVSLKRPQA